ncbi:MAG: radical SAM protein [Candidatus Eremiobacteraeota bacterium]|nr:radical SAM protein [Candidatus Eremiobacteraeota bacterium]
MSLKDTMVIPANAILSRAPGLSSFPRDERLLVIEKESASWMVLEGRERQVFKEFTRPLAFPDFISLAKGHGIDDSDRAADFAARLYLKGIIESNGRHFCNVRSLWDHSKTYTYPGFLCLHPTEQCNFGCHYCLSRAGLHREKMPLATGEKIIDKILTELPLRHLCVDFHGGEPFLVIDEVKRLIDRAHRLGREGRKKVTFCIQTNGSLVTGEDIDWLRQYDTELGFSIDGPEEIHDRHRVFSDGRGSFRKVWENFERVREQWKPPGVLAVVDDPLFYNDVFDFFVSKGIRSFRINFSSCIGRAEDELEFSLTRAEEFATHYLEMVDRAYHFAKEHGVRLKIEDLTNQIRNIVTRERPFMCDRSPCGAGRSILGFGTDGGIYACEEVAGLGDFRVGNIFKVPSLKNMVDENLILRGLYERTVENIPKCRKCTYKRFCGGGCTTKTFTWFGSFMRESPMCRFYQKVYHELFWKIHERPDMVELLSA